MGIRTTTPSGWGHPAEQDAGFRSSDDRGSQQAQPRIARRRADIGERQPFQLHQDFRGLEDDALKIAFL